MDIISRFLKKYYHKVLYNTFLPVYSLLCFFPLILNQLFDSYHIRWIIFKTYMKIFMKLTGTTLKKDESTIKNLEILNNSKENFVIITNHHCYVDHWITIELKNCYTALIAKFLTYIPFMGALMTSNSFFPVNRKNRQQIITKLIEYCNKRPTNICIFPEGGFTDKVSDTLLPFRTGAFTLSKLLNYKIVIFVLDARNVMNDFHFYPGNSINLRLIEFVDPNDFEDIESLKDYCFNKMSTAYSELISVTNTENTETKIKSE